MKRIIIFAIMILLGGTVCCVAVFIFANPADIRQIASYDLSDGYSIKVWDKCRWGDDFCPYVYYEIAKFDSIIVPTTYIAIDRNYKFDMKIVFAEKGNLVCVYDTKLWTENVLFIFDKRSGESWPRLHYPDQWVERYARLKLENPNLPPKFTQEF